MLNAGAGQTLSVTFTPTDTANYTSAMVNVLITVNKATPTITWSNPAGITYGTALSGTQLNATASVPGTFAYTPAAGTVLNAGAGQTLSVTFTPTDTANYTSATTSGRDHGHEGDADDHVARAGRSRLRHGAQRDAAERDGERAGHVRLHAGGRDGADAGAGQTLSVTFTPTDAANYTTATATVAITVTKATPTITWPTPADISSTAPRSARRS